MADITDSQVDSLLRQAEERLTSGSSVTKTTAQEQAPEALVQRTVLQPQQSRSTEKLSLRQPQAAVAPKKDDAGPNWFNLPKTDLTSEFKRDWQVLRMRNVLDPKQQRKSLSANPPKFSQVGEIIAGPTDFYSGRLTRKERKRNLLQEAFHDQGQSKIRNKSSDIRRTKASGKKAFYQRLVTQRKKNKY